LIIKNEEVTMEEDRFRLNISAPMPSLVYYDLRVLRSNGNTLKRELPEIRKMV